MRRAVRTGQYQLQRPASRQPVATSWLSGLTVLVLFGASIWPRYVFIPIAGVGLSPFSLGVLFMLGVSAFTLATKPPKLSSTGTAASALLACFVGWTLVCDALGEYPAQSMGTTIRNAVYLYAGYVIGVALICQPQVLRKVPVVFTAITLIVCLIGLWERLAERSFVDAVGLSAIMANSADVEPLLAGSFRDDAFRASSLFAHSIIFAQYVAASTGLVLVYFLRQGILNKALGGVTLLLIPAAVYASTTRSGYIVLMLSAGVFGVCYLRTSMTSGSMIKIILLLGVPALILGMVLQDDIQGLIIGRTATEISSSDARSDMIATGLGQLMSSPIWGFGEGTSALKAGLVGTANILTIDNHYLSIVLDFGIVGFSLYVAFYAVVIKSAFSHLALSGKKDATPGLIAFVVSIIVGQYVVSIQDNIFFVYIFAGVLCTLPPTRPRAPPTKMVR